MEDLKEFWDPDTVDLMEWIQASTPATAAFTGSMQLLAGVRLSTWRPITNHPHFEDKALRDRTKEVRIVIDRVWKPAAKPYITYTTLKSKECFSIKCE